MSLCKNTHTTSIQVKTSIRLKRAVSYLSSLGLAGNYSLRERSRRGIKKKKKIPFRHTAPDLRPMSKVSGGLRAPPCFRKPCGSLGPQIKGAAAIEINSWESWGDSLPGPPRPSTGNPKYGMPGLQPAPPPAAHSPPQHLCDHSAHGARTVPNRPRGPAHQSPQGHLPAWPGGPFDFHSPFQGHCSRQPSLEGLSPTYTQTAPGRIEGRRRPHRPTIQPVLA